MRWWSRQHCLTAVAVAAVTAFGGSPLAPAARGAENRYDVLAKTLAPFLDLVVAKPASPNRAVYAELTLASMTDLPPEMAGATAALALQYPDRVMLRGKLLGREAAICRVGQRAWAAPGEWIAFLIGTIEDLPPPDPAFQLEPFQSPVPEKQLVWLPALFEIADAPRESVAGTACRVLDLRLAPELGRALNVESWAGRLWATDRYRPAKLRLTRPGWSAEIDFKKMEFAPSLPAATWEPPPQFGGDVLWLDAPRLKQLLDAADREINRRRPAGGKVGSGGD